MADDDSPYKYSTGDSSNRTDEREEDEEQEGTSIIDDAIEEAEEDDTMDENETENTYTPYRDDALYMTEDTSVGDVIEFLRRSIEDPIEDGDLVIWNFSTHEMDEDAVDALKRKEQDHFVIPYQVTGAWGFMFTLLPEEIKDAEILVYDPKKGHYMAYRSLYRTTADDRMDQIRQDLSRRMVAASGEVLGLIE